MISTDKVTEIFCLIDEFYKEFEYFIQKSLIGVKSKRPSTMSSSEIMTIIVLFHTGCFRNFKHFYIGYVQKHMQNEFPNTVSYNRFTELMQNNLLPLTMLLKLVVWVIAQVFLLWIPRQLEFVKINELSEIKFLKTLLILANQQWVGSMDLNYI